MENDLQLVKMAEIGMAENATRLKTTLGSFPFSGDGRLTSIGDLNVEAVKIILEELRIRLTFVDTSGERGRTIVFKNLTGEILVTTLNRVGDGEKR